VESPVYNDDKLKGIAQIIMCHDDLYSEYVDSDNFMLGEEIYLESAILFKALRSFILQGNDIKMVEEKVINIIYSQVDKEYVINDSGVITPKTSRPIFNKKEKGSHTKTASAPSSILTLDYETQLSLAYIYNKLFDVDKSYYNHIIQFIPNIKMSPILIEAFVYLKFIEIKNSHNQVRCDEMHDYYKSHIEEHGLSHLIINSSQLLIEPKEPFKTIESQAGLLITLLAVPNSCEDFTVTWDALTIKGLLAISNGVFNNNSLENEQRRGVLKRIISNDFKQSYYKICFSTFKDSLDGTSPKLRNDYNYQYQISYANECYQEYIKLAAGVLNSKDWSSVEEIPDSWLALL
jgi:hypothetical protein